MNDNEAKVYIVAFIENIVTMICTTVLVLGLYWMTRTFWMACFGFSLLLAVNTITFKNAKTGEAKHE